MKLKDFFFYGVGVDEFVVGDDFGLVDVVGVVGGLGFDGGILLGVEVDDGVGGGEVEVGVVGFE